MILKGTLPVNISEEGNGIKETALLTIIPHKSKGIMVVGYLYIFPTPFSLEFYVK